MPPRMTDSSDETHLDLPRIPTEGIIAPDVLTAAFADGAFPTEWLSSPMNWGYSGPFVDLLHSCDPVFTSDGDAIDDGVASGGLVEDGTVTVFGSLISFNGRRWFVRFDLARPPETSWMYLVEAAGSGRRRISRYSSADQIEPEEWEQRVEFVLS